MIPKCYEFKIVVEADSLEEAESMVDSIVGGEYEVKGSIVELFEGMEVIA